MGSCQKVVLGYENHLHQYTARLMEFNILCKGATVQRRDIIYLFVI
jgi:hypothetical protein